MTITLCFYLEQHQSTIERPGPNLTEWLALKQEFGCELASIHWKHTVENEDTVQVPQFHSPIEVMTDHPDATHVFISEGSETAFADLPSPAGDVVYYFGRNSKGFRGELDDFEGLTYANLPGGDLWAVEAAKLVMNV